MFRDESPIDEQWLRDTWEIAHSFDDGDGRTYSFAELATPHNDWTKRTAMVMVSFKYRKGLSGQNVLVYFLGHWITANRGQLTALMFGIGRHPK